MVSLKDIIQEIQKEKDTVEYRSVCLEEQILIDENVLLGEILNPDDCFDYSGERGFFYYYDTSKNLFFVRLVYQPTSNPYFELKTGWFENNDITKPKYDPVLPPNVLVVDTNKRGNTVAKIFRDEILSFFANQNLSNKLIIRPISVGRYKFSIRMVKKFTPNNLGIRENFPLEIVIEK